MIFGYAREHLYPRMASLKEQGRSILDYCKNVLNVPFDERNLYVDYLRNNRAILKVADREAASIMLFRAQPGDLIIVQSFKLLFVTSHDIVKWPSFLRNGKVELHLTDMGKSIQSMNSDEVLAIIDDAKESRKRGKWGAVLLTPDGKIPVGNTRWIKVPRTKNFSDWVKIAETKDGVVPFLIKSQNLDEIVTLDEAERAKEYSRILKFLNPAS